MTPRLHMLILILWLASAFLFVFTRMNHIFALPILAAPFLLAARQKRLVAIACLAGILAMASVLTMRWSNRNLGYRRTSIVKVAIANLKKPESYRQAINYLIWPDKRPYFGEEMMTPDYKQYRPKLSAWSNRLGWFNLPKLAWLWPAIVSAEILRLNGKYRFILALLILALFAVALTQCFLEVSFDAIPGRNEVWRHLQIADACFVFALIATVGLRRRG